LATISRSVVLRIDNQQSTNQPFDSEGTTIMTKSIQYVVIMALSGMASVAMADTKVNGISVNGISVNGISLNGVSLNGTMVNGVSLNGISLNGISLNGISLNGISLNGERTQGVTTDQSCHFQPEAQSSGLKMQAVHVVGGQLFS
jgi:uncharacterized protein YjbI with pentapeptide repeats